MKQEKQLLAHKKATLEALNPQSVLSRGFTLTVDQEGHLIKAKTAKAGDIIKTIFDDGVITSEVKEVENK